MASLTFSTVPYDRPLPRPIVTAHGTYRRRRGLLLRLADSRGHIGLGDAAPLPGFSDETFEQVQLAAATLQARVGVTSAVDSFIPSAPAEWEARETEMPELTDLPPSLRFAWETALADLAARRAGVQLAHWLSKSTADSVAVNAMLGDAEPADMARQARRQVQAGYEVFKIKVAAGPLARDVARVAAVRDVAPDVRLRLDANAGWNVSQLRQTLAALHVFRIEFLEQPIPAGQWEIARALCDEHGIPLALDEELTTVQAAFRLIERRACQFLILKPMILGGLCRCLRLADLARQQGMQIIYTSVWESDVGLGTTLHLAAALGPTAPACGLSTAGTIASGIVDQPLAIEAGRLRIPTGPGLAMTLAPELLP